MPRFCLLLNNQVKSNTKMDYLYMLRTKSAKISLDRLNDITTPIKKPVKPDTLTANFKIVRSVIYNDQNNRFNIFS